MINILKKKQVGVTILLLTVTLLLISTLLTLFSARYSTLQQKISANLYTNQQAFAAAQAGLEVALPYFQANYPAISANQSGGFLLPYVNSNTQNVTLTNGSKYTFVFSNPTANNYNLITVTSTGINADGTSTRSISQQLQAYSSGPPPSGITASVQGNITLNNSASLNNTQSNFNIKAGSNITFKNSSQTTTSSGVGSNSSGLGNDAVQNDSATASMTSSDFFQSIMGVSQSTAQSHATSTYTNSENTSYNFLNGVTGATIWINQTDNTATIDGTTVIGSPSSPVILIINGTINISNTAVIYGLVFVLGSNQTLTLKESAMINGEVATTGNISLKNSASINYNTSVLNALPSIGGISSNYAKVPGSWKDF